MEICLLADVDFAGWQECCHLKRQSVVCIRIGGFVLYCIIFILHIFHINYYDSYINYYQNFSQFVSF